MNREELQKLLETPLDPNLDYFDATASIEAMANHIRELHKLINFMFETMALQGQSILDLRQKQVAAKGAIEFLAELNGCETDEGPIAGVKAPALVGPDGRKLS